MTACGITHALEAAVLVALSLFVWAIVGLVAVGLVWNIRDWRRGKAART